jgi:hypothetical protein
MKHSSIIRLNIEVMRDSIPIDTKLVICKTVHMGLSITNCTQWEQTIRCREKSKREACFCMYSIVAIK